MPYVYILSNPELPGIVKIGKSRFDPTKRAGQLSRYTGVLGEFKVEWSRGVEDAGIAERLLHFVFRKSRQKKEFFVLESHVAKTWAKTVLDGLESIDSQINEKLENYFNNSIPSQLKALELSFEYIEKDKQDSVQTMIQELKQIQKRISSVSATLSNCTPE